MRIGEQKIMRFSWAQLHSLIKNYKEFPNGRVSVKFGFVGLEMQSVSFYYNWNRFENDYVRIKDYLFFCMSGVLIQL